jgi:hypothetical protein
MAGAGGLQTGTVAATAQTGFETDVAASPTLLPWTTAAQPVLEPPAIATSPVLPPALAPQADPAHATGMTAGLPIVDPH